MCVFNDFRQQKQQQQRLLVFASVHNFNRILDFSFKHSILLIHEIYLFNLKIRIFYKSYSAIHKCANPGGGGGGGGVR